MKKLFALLMAIAVVAILGAMSHADTTYQDFDGNYAGLIKVDGSEGTTVYLNDDGTQSAVATDKYIVFTTDGTHLSFVATGVLVDSMYMKGGDGYRIYTFNPAVASAEDLECPLNNGGNVPTISHYGLVGFMIPTITPTPTITITPTPTEDVTPTITLPVTGGIDTNAWYIGGLGLILLGVALRVRPRVKN